MAKTCDRNVYDFALKGPKKYKLFKRYVISPPNVENLRFSISGLAQLRNLRICGLIQKIADLQYADWHIQKIEICGFAIAE